jgi:hypothetical protein
MAEWPGPQLVTRLPTLIHQRAAARTWADLEESVAHAARIGLPLIPAA